MAYYLKFVFGNVLVDKKYQDRNIQVEAPKCEDIALLEYFFYKEVLFILVLIDYLVTYKIFGISLKQTYTFINHISSFYKHHSSKIFFS